MTRLHHRGGVVLACAVGLTLAPPRLAGEPAVGRRTLSFGVMGEEPTEPDRLLRLYGPFLAAIRKRLGADGIEVPAAVVARDLGDLAERVARGEVDFVIETLFPSLLLRERAPALQPALLVVRRQRRRYRSVFFAPSESPVGTLDDLRGRTLALQDESSTSGFALPRAELLRAGLLAVPAEAATARPDAIRYLIAGAEINQAVWVVQGRADAGAFSDADWSQLPEKIRARLRVFHETKALPRGLLCFRGDLAPEVRARAERVLLRLHEDEEGRAALEAAVATTRFEPLSADDLAELQAWVPILRRAGAVR
jgi:phosphonate transport system substrate-binding protein